MMQKWYAGVVYALVLSAALPAQAGVTLLSSTTTSNLYPQINSAGWVVWDGFVNGAGTGVYLWNGSSIQQLSPGPSVEAGVQVNDAGRVIWPSRYSLLSPASTNVKLYWWAGGSAQQLTNDQGANVDVVAPQLNSTGQVVWARGNAAPRQIYLWTGSAELALTNDTTDNRNPHVNDSGDAVWEHYDGTHWQIELWNGSSVQPLTANGLNNVNPQINNAGQVVWQAASTGNNSVYLWNGSSVQQFTNGQKDDQFPQINAKGQIAWARYENSGWDIWLWDGSSIRQLTSDALESTDLRMNDSAQVVWRHTQSAGSSSYTIDLWNGAYVQPLAPYSSANDSPAINGAGKVVWHGWDGSNDQIYLYTPTAPAAPTALAAGVPSATQVDLTWTDNSDDEYAFAVWRSENGGSYACVAVLAPNSTAYLDTGLTTGASYSYEVRATNNTGASAWSNQVTVALVPPAAPTNLGVSSLTTTTVALSWTDNSNNETAFAIWRSAGGGAFARIAVVAPHVTGYADSAVADETTYTYEVRATNNVGASAWSNQVTVTPTLQPPAAPTGLSAVAGSPTQVSLAWTDNSYNETAFAVWRSVNGGAYGRVAVLAPNSTAYLDTGLTTGASYSYEVRATNNTGASAWSNQVAVAMVSPAAPSNLGATVLSSSQIHLAWTDNSNNETAFAIWRQSGGGAFVRVGVVAPNTTGFTDSGLAPNTPYTYEVRATNNIGASAWTNQVSATTAP